MEYNASEMAEWLFEADQDFTFGAKAASCLHPATAEEDDTNNSSSAFELPDWMETRDNLGSTNMDLFQDMMLPNSFGQLSSSMSTGLTSGMEEEDYSQTISPEDMLVPLSELQPQVETPQGMSANPALESPKITINLKRVIVPTVTMKNSTIPSLSTAPAPNNLQIESTAMPLQWEQPIQSNIDETYHADELLDELVKMVDNEPKLQDFDSVMLEENMQDLLSQLETPNAQLDTSDVSSWGSDPLSPVSLPSPVPSCGSLSPPQSTSESSFHIIYPPKVDKSSTSPYIVSEVLWSPGETSFGDPSSPSKIDTSVLSPADEASNTDSDWNTSEMHSYSRSSSKKRTRRSNARATPYPENKRERKKEQNKQAALRYRQKKKQEDDEFMAQIAAEEERKEKLQARYMNLKQELSCMKKIMREVFIAKGVISADAFKKK